jgi:hypothetical protein
VSQPWYVSHAETIAQNVIGLLCGFVILQAFGVATTTTLKVQATFFVVAYVRSYCIRRLFNRLGARKGY